MTIVTPENAPLALLGSEASEAVVGLLDERGIDLVTDTYPDAFGETELAPRPGAVDHCRRRRLAPEAARRPARRCAPGRRPLRAVDAIGRVPGAEDVYAAGDITTFPVKQGGLAAQQADVAAERSQPTRVRT